MAGKMLLGETHNGKTIYVNTQRNRSVLMLFFGEGGELPAELAGAFSSMSNAQEAVDKYLERTKPVKSTRGIRSAQRAAKKKVGN